MFPTLMLLLQLLGIAIAYPEINRHEGATFQQMGYIVSGLSWAHIHAKIPLTTFEMDVNRFEEVLDKFEAILPAQQTDQSIAKLTLDERKRLEAIRRLCKTKIKKMKATVTEVERDMMIHPRATQNIQNNRAKRQIAISLAAMAGMVVGAVASSIFSQFKTASLVDVLEKRVETITAQVDHNSIGVIQNSNDIKRINHTMNEITETIKYMILNQKTYDHYFSAIFLVLLLEEQEQRLSLFNAAIDQLLLGHLHKDLISTDALLQALDDIKRDALRKGLLIGAQTPLELYQLPTSFIYNATSREIHAMVHIPMYRESHILSLYQYIPTPILIQLHDVQLFLEILPMQQYLAQSQDGTLLRTMTTLELDSCLAIGRAYFCDNNAIEKTSNTNCLANLYHGLDKHNYKTCNFQILEKINSINRISRNKYIIASSGPVLISTDCYSHLRQPTKKIPPGVYTLEVDTTCTTTSDHWVITPTLQIEDVFISTIITPLDIEVSNIFNTNNVTAVHLQHVQDLLKEIGRPVPLSELKQINLFRDAVEQSRQEYQALHFAIGPATSTLTLCIIICVLFGLWKWRHHRQPTNDGPTTHASNNRGVELQIRQRAPSPTPEQRLLNFPVH